MTSAAAPGKIILFGEHAVVYGQPALAVPVTQVGVRVEVSDSTRPGIWLEAPNVNLHSELKSLSPDHPLAVAILSLFTFLGIDSFPWLQININSTIPVAAGLGSGAAVSVALLRALSTHLNQSITNEQISALAYEVEKLYHGTPSGIDNTVVTYGRPVFFIKGNPIEVLRVAEAFTMVIGDTGIPAPTREAVAAVRRLWEADPPHWETLFDRIGRIALQARKAIEAGAIQALGPLMDENHGLLQEMTVSSPELDRLVEAARQAGADGAKLSGGGRGGNMIALVRPEAAEKVSKSLERAGAKRALITRLDKNKD